MSTKLISMFAGAVAFSFVGTSNATVFYLDEFTVTKTENNVTTTFFQDTFSDGIAPKHVSIENPAPVYVNPTDRAYITTPSPALLGPEANGKLGMDTADGSLNLSPVNNVANLHHSARVNSSSTNGAAALWRDDQIVVEALFDLTVPELNRERFGIRLTDWTSGVKNEDIEMVLRRRSDGEVRFSFRQANFVTNSFDIIQQWNPTLGPNFNEYEQVALSIFNDPLDLESFSSSFTLFDNDNILSNLTRTSVNQGQLFQVSDWVRPEFFVNRSFVVPSPMTITLMGIGLAGIGYRHKKSK